LIKKQPRLRIFAGPNGSGKSTIIQAVKNHRVKDIPVDFGIYINADDIAKSLRTNGFSFYKTSPRATQKEFVSIALDSGLINKGFTKNQFIRCFQWNKNVITLINKDTNEILAQIIADFLRKKLLAEHKKFSFETVFSHKGKLDIMKEASEKGYKVYLYFVCTESPEINKFRVKEVRVKEGGHDVPEEKITSRYYRSLDLLFDAAQWAYQVYFFDNSGDEFSLFAHFKKVKDKKVWVIPDPSKVPQWFLNYYSTKVAATK
jgi:predicted ABC-type ATPase